MKVFLPMNSFVKNIALFLILLNLGSFFCSSTLSDYTNTPVFFIHGAGMYASSWNTFIKYLKNSGYPEQYMRTIQLEPFDGKNIAAAENQIAPAIEQFLKEVNHFLSKNHPEIPLKTKVDLVSHSMGGLSSRWYAARIRPERVRTWISLAGANHGTDDLCKYIEKENDGPDDCCPAFAQNEKESYIQYQLNGAPYLADVDETPYGIGKDSIGVARVSPDDKKRIFYVTIRTIDDKWISPDESVILDGCGGIKINIPDEIPATETSPGNIRMENNVEHDPMLSDAATMKLVKIILDIEIDNDMF